MYEKSTNTNILQADSRKTVRRRTNGSVDTLGYWVETGKEKVSL
jgi:hypothetical protein